MIEVVTENLINEFVEDMPWQDYLRVVALNPSRLVRGLKSMKHLYVDDADEKPQRQTLVGSATHALILEPDRFEDRYAVYDGVRRGKKYDMWAWQNEGKEALKPDEYEQARRTADAVMSDRFAREILDQTKHEVSLFVEWNGMQCKGRADCIGSGLLVDVKTTTNVHRKAFGRVFGQLEYGAKLAAYREFAWKLGVPITDVKIISVETKGDYDCAVVPVPDAVLDSSWNRMERILERIPRCLASNHWPGVAEDGEYELDVPLWSMDEDQILDWS